MKDRMKRLLRELLKDSKRSDRELAKVLGVSQPTITRLRHKLVDEGIIQGFTIIPEFTKLGYEIMAITLAKAKTTLEPDKQERARKLVLTNPSVIFVASGEGMGMNGVMISLHRNYSDYVDFMQNLRLGSIGYMEKVDSMLVSLKSSAVFKPLSPAYLAERGV
ncbi:MAG: winged helix-turn-helix transcriptional regulator [Candidatus Bathyarchaeota archaeon]|nr:winged helix-turn-helix transcriptional regulator [Candidatus Bathyarchaeota archaeon]